MPRVFWSGARWVFFCPACACHHFFDERWTFNGDASRPTAFPSIHSPATGCHLHLVDGRITYLGDSRHALAGKTVDCPEA